MASAAIFLDRLLPLSHLSQLHGDIFAGQCDVHVLVTDRGTPESQDLAELGEGIGVPSHLRQANREVAARAERPRVRRPERFGELQCATRMGERFVVSSEPPQRPGEIVLVER
jgi:hypothetical protein